jgi:phosphoribosylpyrophosphate synthetase
MDLEIKTEYLHGIYNPNHLTSTVDKAVEKTYEIMVSNSFDTIVFTGNSGAALAYTLAYKLGLPLLCVRKQDNSHYLRRSNLLEGNVSTSRYIIVDDFIDTGTTVKHVVGYIKEHLPKATCVGVLLYLYSQSAASEICSSAIHTIGVKIPIYGSY